MKKALTLFLFTFICLQAQSQNEGWIYQFGSISDDNILDIEFDANNNMYILGTHSALIDLDPSTNTALIDTANGTRSNFLLKLDPQGQFLWAQSAPIPIKDIDVDDSGNIYFTGHNYDASNWQNWGTLGIITNPTVFYGKLASDGSFLWAKSINQQHYYILNKFNSIEVKNDGSFYIGGSISDTMSIPTDTTPYLVRLYPNSFSASPTFYKAIVLHIKNDGKLNWANILFENGHRDFITKLHLSSDETRLFASGDLGNYGNYQSYRRYERRSVYWELSLHDGSIIKDVVASSEYDDIQQEYVSCSTGDRFSMSEDGRPCFIGAGISDMNFTNIDYGYPNSEPFMAIGNYGLLLNDLSLDPEAITRFLVGSDNSIYVAKENYISRMDMNGNFNYCKYMEGTKNLKLDRDGNLYVYGSFSGDGNFHLDTLTSNGSSDGYIRKFTQDDFLKSVEVAPLPFELSVYPNPVLNKFNVDLGASYEQIDIQLYDAQGRLLKNQSFQHLQVIQLGFQKEYAPGQYFLAVQADGKKQVIPVIRQ